MHSSQKKMDIGKGSKLAHRRPWRRRTKHRVSRLSGRGATSSSSCWKRTDHFARTGGAFKPRWLVWQWHGATSPKFRCPPREFRAGEGGARAGWWPIATGGQDRPHVSTTPPRPHPPESASGLDARAPPLALRRRRRPPGERRSRAARTRARRLRLVPGSWFRFRSVLFFSVRFRA